jgi:hypothetical protein
MQTQACNKQAFLLSYWGLGVRPPFYLLSLDLELAMPDPHPLLLPHQRPRRLRRPRRRVRSGRARHRVRLRHRCKTQPPELTRGGGEGEGAI